MPVNCAHQLGTPESALPVTLATTTLPENATLLLVTRSLLLINSTLVLNEANQLVLREGVTLRFDVDSTLVVLNRTRLVLRIDDDDEELLNGTLIDLLVFGGVMPGDNELLQQWFELQLELTDTQEHHDCHNQPRATLVTQRNTGRMSALLTIQDECLKTSRDNRRVLAIAVGCSVGACFFVFVPALALFFYYISWRYGRCFVRRDEHERYSLVWVPRHQTIYGMAKQQQAAAAALNNNASF